MSLLSKQLAAPFAQIHAFAGDAFTLNGASYVGVFGTAESVSPMTAAGFTEDISLTAVVRIAQFTTLPKVRDRIRYAGKDYSIVKITNDRQGVHLVLALRDL